ncbi:MAG: hypothetical protein AB8G05_01115 [Oligoflexales bacterium]
MRNFFGFALILLNFHIAHASDFINEKQFPVSLYSDHIVPLAPPQEYDSNYIKTNDLKNDENDAWLHTSEISKIYTESMVTQAAIHNQEPNYENVVSLINERYHEWLDSMFEKTDLEAVKAYISLHFTSNTILNLADLAAQDAVKDLSREITIYTACQAVRRFASKASWRNAIDIVGKPIKANTAYIKSKNSFEEFVEGNLYHAAYNGAKKNYDFVFESSRKNRSTAARISAQLSAERVSLIYLYENLEMLLDLAFSSQSEIENQHIFIRKIKKLKKALNFKENSPFISTYTLVWGQFFLDQSS